MKKIKCALLLLPVLALASCGKEDIHVSRPKEVETKFYDNNGNVDKEKEIYSYDKKGNTTAKETFVYDEESKRYVPSEKCDYSYDSKGNETLYVEYAYIDGSYKLSQKIASTYSNNNLVKRDFYDVNKDNNEPYLKFYEGDFVYDSLGRLTSTSTYHLNSETTNFDKVDTTTYEYKDNFKEFVKCNQKDFINPAMDMEIVQELDEKGRVSYSIGSSLNGVFALAEYFVYNEYDEVQSEADYDVVDGVYYLNCTIDKVYVKGHYLAEEHHTYYNSDASVKIYECSINGYDKNMNLVSHKEYELDFETNEMKIEIESSYSY